MNESLGKKLIYNQTVMEHFKNPRNVGEIEDADGIGIYMSDFCGDITKFWVKISGGRIDAVTYKTQGCVASVACGSVLTELIKNKTVKEALQITKDDIVSTLGGLPEQKIHCSVLADDAMKDALRDYLSRNNLPVPQELVAKHEKMRPLLEKIKEDGYILI
jgi:nitrogen fixation protein NifU and related proteins